MTSRKLSTLIACLTVSLLLAAPALAQDTRTFPASPGGTLRLKLETGSDVSVETASQNSIQVTVRGAESCRPACIVDFEPTSGGLTIRSRYASRENRQSGGMSLVIVVPTRFNIELDSMGGGLAVTGLQGEIRGETMGGDLKLSGLSGELSLSTMGGDIELIDSDVDGKVSTMGGEVLLSSVRGDVKGTSMGGNVVYRNVENTADPGESVGEEVFINTMGGEISVPEAPYGARVKTMGGDIKIESAAEFVEATTMGGSIDIGEVDGRVNAVTMSGDIEVTVVGSGGPVSLSSHSGTITLELPAGISAHFDVELAYTRNSTRSYSIQSDFAMQVEESPDWDYTQGSPRRTIYGRGQVGGGEHLIKIRTINGDVVIRSSR